MPLAAELIATPGLYQELLAQLHIEVANKPNFRAYTGDVLKLTMSDIVSWFAECGLTIAQVDDGFRWGRAFLANSHQYRSATDPTDYLGILERCKRPGIPHPPNLPGMLKYWPAEINQQVPEPHMDEARMETDAPPASIEPPLQAVMANASKTVDAATISSVPEQSGSISVPALSKTVNDAELTDTDADTDMDDDTATVIGLTGK
jgi:hypothetical protein